MITPSPNPFWSRLAAAVTQAWDASICPCSKSKVMPNSLTRTPRPCGMRARQTFSAGNPCQPLTTSASPYQPMPTVKTTPKPTITPTLSKPLTPVAPPAAVRFITLTFNHEPKTEADVGRSLAGPPLQDAKHNHDDPKGVIIPLNEKIMASRL